MTNQVCNNFIKYFVKNSCEISYRINISCGAFLDYKLKTECYIIF